MWPALCALLARLAIRMQPPSPPAAQQTVPPVPVGPLPPQQGRRGTLYTKNGTAVRGVLLETADSFEVALPEVAPQGSSTFRPVMHRVGVFKMNVDFYTIE